MTAVIARAAVVPLFTEPTLRSEQSSQLVLGEVGGVLETAGDWRRVRTQLDQYVGWVHAGYCAQVSAAEAEAWWREATAWSEGAAVRVGEARVRLPLRARVALEGAAVRLPDGSRASIVEGAVTPADRAVSEARGKAPERWAIEHFAGAPYEWGGVTPCGVDCSGVVQTTFLARGVRLPRDSAQQAACGAPVPPDAIRPGDLLFFRGEAGDRITHVAFAGEADTLVHSTVSLGGMVQEPWLPGSRAASLRDRLVAVRRLGAVTRKLVLFDIDGTLLLTAGAGRRAIVAALTDEVGHAPGFERVRFDGKTDPQIVAEMLEIAGQPAARESPRVRELCERYVAYLARELERPTTRTTVMPGVHPLLDRLEAEPGVVLGLLTGNLAEGAALKLRSGGIVPERFRVGAYGSDAAHRPDLPPIAARRAEPIFGRVPRGDEVVIIGDTPADIACGSGIDARALAVATGSFSMADLAACGPHAVFEDLRDTEVVVGAILR